MPEAKQAEPKQATPELPEPNHHVVMVVTTYATHGGPEEAQEQVQDTYDGYETKHFVVAASSLDELPHPSQVAEIAEHFGH